MKTNGRVAGHGCREFVLQAVARLLVGSGRLTFQKHGKKIPESLHGPCFGQAGRDLPNQKSVFTEHFQAEPETLQRGKNGSQAIAIPGVHLQEEREKKGLARAVMPGKVGKNFFVENPFVGRVLTEKIESIGIMGHDETIPILSKDHRGRHLLVQCGLEGPGGLGRGFQIPVQIGRKHAGEF